MRIPGLGGIVRLTGIILLLGPGNGVRAQGVELPAEAILAIHPTIQYHIQEQLGLVPPQIPVFVSPVVEVVSGQLLLLPVSLRDPGPPDAGEWTYDIVVTNPDGSTLSPEEPLAFMSGVNGPTVRDRWSAGFVSWQAEEDNPPGVRTITVTARDAASDRVVEASATFELVPLENMLPDRPVENPAHFFMTYSLAPKPHELPGFAEAVARQPAWGSRDLLDPANHAATMGFFAAVWVDNPWLQPVLKERLEGPDDPGRALLDMYLSYATREDAAFRDSLPAELQARLAVYDWLDWLDPGPELTQGTQLDVLWGRFHATGAREPLQEIVRALNYASDLDAFRAFQARGAERGPPTQAVRRGAVFAAAIWSLSANSRQNPLVRAYLIGMMSDPTLTDLERRYLDEALRAENPGALRDRYFNGGKASLGPINDEPDGLQRD